MYHYIKITNTPIIGTVSVANQEQLYQARYEKEFLSACMDGDEKIVKAYIVKKGDVSISDNLGLIWACEMGHVDIVKFLLEAGACLDARDGEAFQACIINRRTDLQDLFLSKNCHISSKAVEYACSEHQHNILNFIIEKNYDPTLYIEILLKHKLWIFVKKSIENGCSVALVKDTAKTINYSFSEEEKDFLDYAFEAQNCTEEKEVLQEDVVIVDKKNRLTL